MVGALVALAVAAVATVIGIIIVQSVLDGADTTSWQTGTITIVFLIPLVVGAAAIIGILKTAGRL